MALYLIGDVQGCDAALGRLLAAGAWLVLPVSLLLFLQWPLRDLLRAHSREANDLGQIVFAVYVAMAVTAATRRGTHLAMDMLSRHLGPGLRRRLVQAGLLLGVVPWAVFLLWAGRILFKSTALQLEAFSDTANPGYFVVKLSAAFLAVLMLAQALLDLGRPADQTAPPPGEGPR
jgi:TRAP-type C4-dicarboxylate transport system permease small subunit